MRFVTGLIIGSLMGYYYGATHPQPDLEEKVFPDKRQSAYENANKPCLEEYINKKPIYISKLEKISAK